ncbi:MAG TPA: hypothetical protein VEA41_09865 [Salinarimonas sp.]|nr:hypothetical protein [Salinarimonas sp.]
MASSRGINMEMVMKFIEGRIATIPGITLEHKSAWLFVGGPHGTKGPRMYIAKQKFTRQVDLSGCGRDLLGFDPSSPNANNAVFGDYWPGAVPLKAHNGAVRAHLDLEPRVRCRIEDGKIVGDAVEGELTPADQDLLALENMVVYATWVASAAPMAAKPRTAPKQRTSSPGSGSRAPTASQRLAKSGVDNSHLPSKDSPEMRAKRKKSLELTIELTLKKRREGKPATLAPATIDACKEFGVSIPAELLAGPAQAAAQ